jgi:hypothetical protein
MEKQIQTNNSGDTRGDLGAGAPGKKKNQVIFNQMLKGAPSKILCRLSNLMGVGVAES